MRRPLFIITLGLASTLAGSTHAQAPPIGNQPLEETQQYFKAAASFIYNADDIQRLIDLYCDIVPSCDANTDPRYFGFNQAFGEFIQNHLISDQGRTALADHLQKSPTSSLGDMIGMNLGYYYFSRGELEPALAYYSAVTNNFPKSHGNLRGDVEALQKEIAILRDVATSSQTQDERLGRSYELWMDKIRKKNWNEGEVGYGVQYPEKIFSRLKADYPKSPWTAKATLIRLRFLASQWGEGGDVEGNPKLIGMYQDFLNTYPSDPGRMQAIYQMACLHYNYGLFGGHPNKQTATHKQDHLFAARDLLGRLSQRTLSPEISAQAKELKGQVDKAIKKMNETPAP